MNKTPEKNQFWLLLRDLRFLKPVKLNQVKAPRVKRQVMTNDVGRKGIGNDKHFHPSETVRIQKKKEANRHKNEYTVGNERMHSDFGDVSHTRIERDLRHSHFISTEFLMGLDPRRDRESNHKKYAPCIQSVFSNYSPQVWKVIL